MTKEQRVKANAPANARQMLGQPKHMVPDLLAGFIRCSKCGLSFQGQSTRFRGKNNYRYGCGGYNSRRVCDHCQVNRNFLEAFVLDGIDDLLSHTMMVEELQHRLARMAGMQTGDEKSKIRLPDSEKREVKEGIEQILSAVEKSAPLKKKTTSITDKSKTIQECPEQDMSTLRSGPSSPQIPGG